MNYICQIIALWFLFLLFYWTVSNLKVRLKKEKIISGEAIEDRDRKASNLCLIVHQMNWHLLIYLVFKCKISTQCFCINSMQTKQVKPVYTQSHWSKEDWYMYCKTNNGMCTWIFTHAYQCIYIYQFCNNWSLMHLTENAGRNNEFKHFVWQYLDWKLLRYE